VPWVRIDDGFYMHPKVVGLSPAAIGLHLCGLCYAADNLTDGHVPKAAIGRLTSAKTVGKMLGELEAAGMWIDEGKSWRIHDYLKYQPSRAQVLAEREKAAERQRKARDRAAEKRAAQGADNVTSLSRRDEGVSHGTVTVPPTRPDPTLIKEPLSETLTRAVPMAIEAMGLVPGYESAGGASA
jgi:hypothetical protein